MSDSQLISSQPSAPSPQAAPPSPAETPALLPPSLRRFVVPQSQMYPPARPFLVPDTKRSPNPPRRIPPWLVGAIVFYMLLDIAVYEFLKVDIDGSFLRMLLFVLGRMGR